MERRLGEMASSGDRFDYEYDFGTTTRLELRVVASRTAPGDGSPVRLLARNEAPVYRCSDCEEPAVWICPFCSDEWGTWASPAFFCREHGREHSCTEELGELMPVVDSPRMGVCGYTDPAEPPPYDRSR